MKISPNYDSDDWGKLCLTPDSGDWLEATRIFEDRILSRYIEPADLLIESDNKRTFYDLDEDGICDACESMEYIVVDCECELMDPLTYTVFFIDVDEVNCVTIEDCYCECINDINGDGVCDTLCSEDLNSDGAVSVQDLLLVLSEFGCASSCSHDVNQDGYVTVADILLILSVFGDICE